MVSINGSAHSIRVLKILFFYEIRFGNEVSVHRK